MAEPKSENIKIWNGKNRDNGKVIWDRVYLYILT